MSEEEKITKVAVYPPLGIARVGNSPEYYIASEIPGKQARPEGAYKDERGRIKKQAVLFRIYGLNDEGKVVKELTLEDCEEIKWEVHVANRKAAWYQFNNALDLKGLAIPGAPRNNNIKSRQDLVIDPGIHSISGAKHIVPICSGKIMNTDVILGQLRTDKQGRLLFLGGDGQSGTFDGSPITTFANNDGWYDDISDGPVYATVKYNGQTMQAEPGFVATTPPNYGQGLFGVVTMFDVVQDLYIRNNWEEDPGEQLNFWKHIYPIFERLSQTQWVNFGFYMLFGKNSPTDPLEPETLAQLADPSDSAKSVREFCFSLFRAPSAGKYEPTKIPPFYGDAFGNYKGLAEDDLAVTSTQYDWLKRWAEGKFTNEKPKVYNSFEEMPLEEQVKAMTEAPLVECLGGPFHPGIELTWILRNLIMWNKPYRLKVHSLGQGVLDDYGPLLAPHIALAAGGPLDGSGPGSLTRYMGVPWQTDESSCLSGYNRSYYLPLPSFWAARVPNQVLSEESGRLLMNKEIGIGQQLKHFDYRQDWLRDLSPGGNDRRQDMVEEWHQLGIVQEINVGNDDRPLLPKKIWVECERGPFMDPDPTYEQNYVAEHVNVELLNEKDEKISTVSGNKADIRPPRARRVFNQDDY